MILIPGPNNTVGEGSKPRLRWRVTDEYGARINLTGFAIRYKIFRRIFDAENEFRDIQEGDVAATISAPTDGEFFADLSYNETIMPPGQYNSEIVLWSSGTITDVPDERFVGLLTIDARLEAP